MEVRDLDVYGIWMPPPERLIQDAVTQLDMIHDAI